MKEAKPIKETNNKKKEEGINEHMEYVYDF